MERPRRLGKAIKGNGYTVDTAIPVEPDCPAATSLEQRGNAGRSLRRKRNGAGLGCPVGDEVIVHPNFYWPPLVHTAGDDGGRYHAAFGFFEMHGYSPAVCAGVGLTEHR